MNKRSIRHMEFSLVLLDLLFVNVVIYVIFAMLSAGMAPEATKHFASLTLLVIMGWFVYFALTKLNSIETFLLFNACCRKSIHNYLHLSAVMLGSVMVINGLAIPVSTLITVFIGTATMIFLNRRILPVTYDYFEICEEAMMGKNSGELAGIVPAQAHGGNTRDIIDYPSHIQKVQGLYLHPALHKIKLTFFTSMVHGVTEDNSTIDPENHRDMNGSIEKAGENLSRLQVIPGNTGKNNENVKICYLNGVPLIPLKKEPLEALSSRIAKRAVDIIVSSLVILLILSWMVPIIGLLIWLESRGPVFFLQSRSGKGNKPFMCMKFRSMKVNSTSNEQQATQNDSRITRTGKFLRRTSLDEFPQFLNVLKGDMSIVGPRPHMLKHTDEYSVLIDNFMVRQLVKPGITGWAQVNGLRGETSHLDQMRDRVNYDIWYMENWNHLLDFKIIFLTVYNTVKGEAMAY